MTEIPCENAAKTCFLPELVPALHKRMLMTRTRLERNYETVGTRLADRKRMDDYAAKGFSRFCMDLGIPAIALDNLMYERLGMSGDEVLGML